MRDLTGCRVLVTGGRGFIGRHLTERLLREGAEVFALQRRDTGGRESANGAAPGLHRLVVDLEQPRQLRACVHDLRPEIVFHAAAARAEEDRQRLWAVNVQASRRLVEACAGIEGVRVISFGSALEMLAHPASAYGESRVLGAKGMLCIAARHGLSLWHLRTGVVVGEGMGADKLIPAAIRAARSGEEVPIAPDTVTRNYVAVEDLIEAALAALRRPAPGGRTVNAVAPVVHSAAEVCAIVARCLGRDIAQRPDPTQRRVWDRFDWTIDPRPAKRMLDWQTRRSLAASVARMVAASNRGGSHATG